VLCMNEALFQFIWQNNLYVTTDLQTTDGEQVTVIYSGRLNRDAGPDFCESRVRIGNTTLVGNVELHLKSSDWPKHGHQIDPAYQNLILHVVFEDDMPGVAAGHIPVLEMKDNIPQTVMEQYNKLYYADRKLPCAGLHNGVKYIIKEGWLSRLLAERWEQKLEDWNVLLENSAEDWRNLLYWRMAANFGFKVNAVPFQMLAQSLPLNIIAKHRDSLFQIEALLFGQSGMLEATWEDEYPNDLQKEYGFLRRKYKLTPLPAHLWKFLRMRPANFPTVRIAQFAALIQQSVHLFSKVIETHSVRDLELLFEVTASEYWDTHFCFDELQKKAVPKALGKTSVQNIIINTVAPIQFLYATRQDSYKLLNEALQLLETIAPEKNNITDLWEENGWKAANAAQSQALLQLYNHYCSEKRCLECSIGLSIIRSTN